MINCPVCERKDIKGDKCPGCDTDLRPLLRIQVLPKVYYEKGEQFFTKGLLNESVENLLMAVAFNPAYIEPLMTLGKIYGDKKLYDEAIWFYKRILDIDPSNETANNEVLRLVNEKERLKNNQINKENKFKTIQRLLIAVPVIAVILTVLIYQPVSDLINAEIASSTVASISNKIKEKISNHPILSGLQMELKTLGDTISLNGQVPTVLHKYLTDEVINNISGIEKIDFQNKLIVGKPGVDKFSYTVKKGDSLSSLAFLFYNSSSSWKLIYDANMETLKSPNELYAGMVISIPVK